jgi:hypothetical protein
LIRQRNQPLYPSLEGSVPNDTPPTARYRQLAREAWAAANTLPVGKARDAVLHMAQVWERHANQHAHSTVSLSPCQGEQPVVQQQQQVQPDDDKKE